MLIVVIAFFKLSQSTYRLLITKLCSQMIHTDTLIDCSIVKTIEISFLIRDIRVRELNDFKAIVLANI